MKPPSTRADGLKIVGLALGLTLFLGLAVALLGPTIGDDEPPTEPNTPTEPTTNVPALRSPAPALGTSEIPDNGTGRNFELVAHEPLLDEHQYVGNESFGIPRGSNGEITATGDCVYVGSMIGHQPPLVVDVADPTEPDVVGPVPDAVPGVGNGIEGIQASGDVLAVDHRDAMGVLGFEVPEGLPEHGLSVYDVSNCQRPELVARHDAGDLETHALRLWRDPENPDRLLGVQTFLDTPNVQVVDLTGCPDDDACDPTVVAEWALGNQTDASGATHEAIFSTDGRRIYAAQADAGFLLLDSTNLLASLRGTDDCDPSTPEDPDGAGHCLTVANPDVAASLEDQPDFEIGFPHTLLKIPGRPYFLATGESSGPDWGKDTIGERYGQCPGASLRVHGIAENGSGGGDASGASTDRLQGFLDPHPVGNYSLPSQVASNCVESGWEQGEVPSPGWLSPHFPTAFPDVAFVTYYGGGLRAIDVSDPAAPREAGYFYNDPVDEIRWAYHGQASDSVDGADGRAIRRSAPKGTHLFAFSYPVTVDGYLLYADSQSGLYVLEYTGPHADQIPDDGTCLPANPGAVEPGYEPCPPYGQTTWTAGGS